MSLYYKEDQEKESEKGEELEKRIKEVDEKINIIMKELSQSISNISGYMKKAYQKKDKSKEWVMCRNDWLSKYYHLTLQKKAIEDELKELKQKITEGLSDYGKHKRDGFEVNYQLITSNRFDSIVFKKEHPDIYKRYQKTSESERLTVKPIA